MRTNSSEHRADGRPASTTPEMAPPPSPPRHLVYVLRCADGSLYAGYATDVDRRLAEHQSGRGAKYTRGRRPVSLVATWSHLDRPSALRAEAAFKRLGRAQKLVAISAAQPRASAANGDHRD